MILWRKLQTHMLHKLVFSDDKHNMVVPDF